MLRQNLPKITLDKTPKNNQWGWGCDYSSQSNRAKIVIMIGESITTLKEKLTKINELKHDAASNAVNLLIASQTAIEKALSDKDTLILFGDHTDELFKKHIEESARIAEKLVDLIITTRPSRGLSKLGYNYQFEAILYNIEQLTLANTVLADAISNPEKNLIHQDRSNDESSNKDEYYRREKAFDSFQCYPQYVSDSIDRKREHLPFIADMKAHLKRNTCLATFVAISVTAIALTLTLPALAPLTTPIIVMASLAILTSLAIYAGSRDRLRQKRRDEEFKKDSLYSTHMALFSLKRQASIFAEKALVEKTREPAFKA